MGEESIWAELNQLKSDVGEMKVDMKIGFKEITDAIGGNKKLDSKGLGERVEDVEKGQRKIYKVAGIIATTIAAIFSTVIGYIFK
jgi:hypothetical protein